MRLFIAATVAASLFATNLLAADLAAPLPAGKPAGVQKAQLGGINPAWFAVGGLGILAAVVATSKASPSAPNTTTG